MRFETNREDLLKALQAVIGAVEKLQTMPILSHVLIKAANNELELTGTDLRLELVAQAPAKIKEAGSVAVNARKLFDICRSLPDGLKITGDLKDGRITLKAGASRFVLATMPGEEFPVLEDLNVQTKFSLDKAAMKKLLERSHFAMAHDDDPRRYLAGLLLVVQKSRVRCVATDGHRLALAELPVSLETTGTVQVIIPRKSVVELARLLDSGDGKLELVIASNHLRVETAGLRFTTKLLEGRYPDYERVIPEAGDKRMTANRDGVRQALTRTAILAKERFKGVRLSLESGQLKLQSQNPEQEEAEEIVGVEYDGGPIEIGFNVTYLLDALNCMDGEQFSLELSGPDASGLLKQVGDTTGRFVVMPMRL